MFTLYGATNTLVQAIQTITMRAISSGRHGNGKRY